MRVASLVFAVIAALLPAAHAQTVDKAKPAAEAAVKASNAAKAAAQGKAAAAAAATEASKAKVEGVATQRSMPADTKKSSDDCHHKGSASDA
jgi:hypothetical protein